MKMSILNFYCCSFQRNIILLLILLLRNKSFCSQLNIHVSFWYLKSVAFEISVSLNLYCFWKLQSINMLPFFSSQYIFLFVLITYVMITLWYFYFQAIWRELHLKRRTHINQQQIQTDLFWYFWYANPLKGCFKAIIFLPTPKDNIWKIELLHLLSK